MAQRIVDSIFPVRAGERPLTLALFFHNLFAVGAFLTGRTVRDALFLSHGNRDQLPWMYVLSSAAVAIVGLLYAPLAARARRDRLAVGSALLFAVLFLLAFWLERGGPSWIYPAIYVYVEVMGALALVQLWTLANELFHAREAKRLYGVIGAGGTLANVILGLAASQIAVKIGATALLWLCSILLALTAAAAYVAGRLGRQRFFAKAASGKQSKARFSEGAVAVFSSGHLRLVALLAIVTFITTTVVDFEFKVIAAKVYERDELASFFGVMSAGVGVLALAFQVMGTGRLMGQLGVIGSLALLPSFLAAGNLAFALFPALWAATAAKGADTLFRYSVNDPTTQLLFLPATPHVRAAAKTFVDSVVKPLSIGLCGIALVGYKKWLGGNPVPLAWLSLLLCAGWGAVVLALRPHYVRSLQDNLRNRRLDLATARQKVMEDATNNVLVRALESDDAQEVLNALELLPHLKKLEVDHRVEPLLDHASPEVRIAALSYYARRETMRFANSIFRKFDDADPRVKAAAVEAFSVIGRDKAVRSVKPFLSDADPSTRAAAIVGMIRYGGLDGVLVAAEALKALIQDADPLMRVHAAKVLGSIGVQNFYQPVLQLMNDPDLRVRRQAISAAGALKSPEFVLPLIYRTQATDTLPEAISALAAYGNEIVPTLEKVLGNRHESLSVRKGAARVLGRLRTRDAVTTLTRHLEEPDEELRARVYRALARSVKGERVSLADLKPVNQALENELLRAYHALACGEALNLKAETPNPRAGLEASAALLALALKEKVALGEERIFLLLAVLYPDADMERIYAGIHDASGAGAARLRANAVELLDNLLGRPLKRKLLPLVEEMPRAEQLRHAREILSIEQPTPEEALRRILDDETGWVRACGLWYSAQQGGQSPDDFLRRCKDASPLVRELALVALTELAPEQGTAQARVHLGDEAEVVRRLAQRLATR